MGKASQLEENYHLVPTSKKKQFFILLIFPNIQQILDKHLLNECWGCCGTYNVNISGPFSSKLKGSTQVRYGVRKTQVKS